MYMTLEELIKQYNLQPAQQVVEYMEETDEDEEDDRDSLYKPRNRHIMSEDEWDCILG